MSYIRNESRKSDSLRDVSCELNVLPQAEGSCLIKFGNTHVMCTASVENMVPRFLKGLGKGWVTAEYGMLPRSTGQRMQREISKGRPDGRTQEIQRLIGRSLRSVVDLNLLGERQIIIDCDVISADGGTRTAGITGGFIALALACNGLVEAKQIRKSPIIGQIAAISVGIVNGEPLLDLEYTEDSNAEVDANFVLNAAGGIVEVQATAEQRAFTEEQYNSLYSLAKKGISELFDIQNQALEK
jgi:ribonuclease PH